MKILKNTIASLLVLSTLASAGTFEQNGVKEGNDKLSIGLYSTIHDDDGSDPSVTLYGQYGKMISDDVEVLFDVYTATETSAISGDTNIIYMLAPGVNYYFAKQPTLTPFVGTQIFYSDKITDDPGDFDGKGSRFYAGFHKFLNENAAITPEVNMRFFDFTDYYSTDLKVYLTYFFN